MRSFVRLFFFFLLTLLALCLGISTCLHCFGWSNALSTPPGLFSPDKCSSFSQTDYQSSNGQFQDISCLTIDSVFIFQLRFHYCGNDRALDLAQLVHIFLSFFLSVISRLVA